MSSLIEYELNLFSGQTPTSVKSLPKLLELIDESVFEQIIDLCKQYFRQKQISNKSYLNLKNSIVSSNRLDANNFDLLINATLSLAINCLRVYKSIDSKVIENELINKIHLQTNYCQIFVNQLFADNRVVNHFYNNRQQLYRLRSIEWRIDVSIANSRLSRIMEPLIVFQFCLIIDNSIDCYKEERVVFESKLSNFHKLRFIVANLLKEFNQLEHKNLNKI
jgi:hypothetical protein